MDENQTCTSSSGHQVRLMMWAPPRSISTAFAKFMSFLDESQIWFEPYLSACWFGPEGILHPGESDSETYYIKTASEVTSVTQGFEASECTFGWVKEQLEKPHTGKKVVFCKEMCFSVVADKYEFLPVGYRHMFLLRHPLKVFSSWKKMYPYCREGDYDFDKEAPVLFPSGFAFKEISDLLDYVKVAHDQDPIIIDADDLLNDPRGILTALFRKVGLPFEERFLQWEEGDAVFGKWIICKNLIQGHKNWQYYKNAFSSTCFAKPRALPDRSSLPADVLRCVDASMPYYEKMYAQRLTPDK